MTRKTMFRVVVTYGTRRGMTYAEVPSLDSAQKLQIAAMGLGYQDARIETYERPDQKNHHETHIPQTQDAHCRGQGAAPRLDRRERRVHDLPKFATSA